MSAERSKNFNTFYRDLVHRRFHDPESLPPKVRLKKFGIDPPQAIFKKENEEKRDKADEALYDYAEQQIDKEQNRIDKNKYGKGRKKKVK